MDSSSYDDVIALGMELAGSLEPYDTLGRWMAHYIADLITRANTTDGPDRDRAQRECAAEIIRLWNHRHSFQNSDRPLASYEPIYRALARLDPEQPPWSFFRSFDSDTAPNADQLEINALLKAALAVENAARDAVRALIVDAAEVASQQEDKWLVLAKQIADEESGLIKVLKNRHSLKRRGALDMPADDSAGDETVQAVEALSAVCRTTHEVVRTCRPSGF